MEAWVIAELPSISCNTSMISPDVLDTYHIRGTRLDFDAHQRFTVHHLTPLKKKQNICNIKYSLYAFELAIWIGAFQTEKVFKVPSGPYTVTQPCIIQIWKDSVYVGGSSVL